MAAFTIRVQLEGRPPESSYETLHSKMSALGFYRLATSEEGKVVELPHAMYYGMSTFDAPSVRTMVVNVAQQIQQDIRVFVAQTSAWASHGGVQL